MSCIQICMAQINPTVGAIEDNAQLIIQEAKTAQKEAADLVVFPEMSLCGYPPEDLLLRQSFFDRINAALLEIQEKLQDIAVVIGHPSMVSGKCYNAATMYHRNQRLITYHKQQLPNEGVFDELRYFSPGHQAGLFTYQGMRFALTLCEDLWSKKVAEQAKLAGAQCLISLNASPFWLNKHQQRHAMLSKRIQEQGLPILYINAVGAQDELVFDGDSMALDAQGQVKAQAPCFEPGRCHVHITSGSTITLKGSIAPPLSKEAGVYQALVLGLKDYVKKNHFKTILLGLSGGIDSALSLVIAHDAVGAKAVRCIAMPSRYTADQSNQDAAYQAKLLGIQHSNIAIEPMVTSFEKSLSKAFQGNTDVSLQNLQARIRGTVLMTLSNQSGALLLSTGNKSELSVGYTTLYGDMAGGFCALKDVWKTWVYRLARHRQNIAYCIPERVIKRAPTAELAPDQCDQDTLPPYETLDAILACHIEQNLDASAIIARGHNPETVKQVIEWVKNNEHKRRQAPPGIKVTERALGKDWRLPISCG